MKKSKTVRYTKKTTNAHKQHIAPKTVLLRPVLAMIWGIVSSLLLSSLLYMLCFYPSRDACISPLVWASLLKPYEQLLLISLGLPSFLSVHLLNALQQVSFNTFEVWWTVLSILSIIFAYIVITLISGIILFIRKNRG